MTTLLQWYQLRRLDCSIAVYRHNMSVPLITCQQHSTTALLECHQ